MPSPEGGRRHRLCYDVDVTAFRPDVNDALTRIASAAPGLQLLRHGSRARHEEHAHSDWDFACLPGGSRGGNAPKSLALAGRDGTIQPLGLPAQPYLHPRLSPDGLR